MHALLAHERYSLRAYVSRVCYARKWEMRELRTNVPFGVRFDRSRWMENRQHTKKINNMNF